MAGFKMDDLESRTVRRLSGCHEWTGGRTSAGYGQFQGQYAHRLVWAVCFGAIPDGMCVCHRCDNPRCINPEHLFLGTRADNNRDMFAKGRNRTTPVYGERHGRCKVSTEDVAEMRDLRKAGATLKDLSERFGTTIANVHSIVTNQTRVVA